MMKMTALNLPDKEHEPLQIFLRHWYCHEHIRCSSHWDLVFYLVRKNIVPLYVELENN